MIKKNRLLLIFFFTAFFCFNETNGQEKKNRITIFYSLTYSKSNFTNIRNLSLQTSSWIERLYDTKEPNRGILGYYYGINFSRKIAAKYSIGIGLNYSLNGQQSPNFYSINGISDASLDARPDYGGRAYKITFKSYEVPLNFEYIIKRKKSINYIIRAGVLANIYYQTEAYNFGISRATGKKSRAGIYESFYGNTKPVIKVLSKRITQGLMRIGGLAGFGLEYNAYAFLSLGVASEIRFYGNLFDTSAASTVIIGGFYNVGLNFYCRAKF